MLSCTLIANQIVLNSALVTNSRGKPRAIASMAMLARLRAVSAAAHGTDANMRRLRRRRGGLRHHRLRLRPARPRRHRRPAAPRLRVRGGARRRRAEAHQGRPREGLGEDESMPLGDKVVVAIDVVVGVANIMVGACDFVVGACDFTQYARGALARFRGESSRYLEPNPPRRCFD